MVHVAKNAFLFCISVSMGISALPPSSEKSNPSMALSLLSRYGFSPIRLPKIPNKPAELVWKQIGATHYGYDGTGGSGNEAWPFRSRDTMIYDGAGNVVIRKTSGAQSGWATDSLGSLDSSVYSGNKLTDSIYFSYAIPSGTAIYGSRITNEYLDTIKCVVQITSTWDVLKKSWRPQNKDTFRFSEPVAGFHASDITFNHLIGSYSYTFDTSNMSWKYSGYLATIDSECTATTCVLCGSLPIGDTEELVDIKAFMTFKTSHWSSQNFAEVLLQKKNPLTNTFCNFVKNVYTATCLEYAYWDTTANDWKCSEKDFHFPDAHGNDTVSFRCYYHTGTKTWDTSGFNRYVRAYDVDGNNDTTVRSYFDTHTQTWQLFGKDVNIFAQLDLPVAHPVVSQPKSPVSMTVTGSHIRFSAPAITALKLYTAAGRLVAVVRQEPASAISLRFSDCPVRISSGVYIAEIESAYGKRRFKAAIRR